MPSSKLQSLTLALGLMAANLAIAADEPVLQIDGHTRVGVGVTRDNKTFFAHVPPEWFSTESKKTRILLVGGIDGEARSTRVVVEMLKGAKGDPNRESKPEFDASRFLIGVIPTVFYTTENPMPLRGFPPQEGYQSATQSTQTYLWKWIGMESPDLVVVVDAAEMERKSGAIYIPDNCVSLVPFKKSLPLEICDPHTDTLSMQLNIGRPAGLGSIPAIDMLAFNGKGADAMHKLLAFLTRAKFQGPSPARAEKIRRQARSEQQLIEDLLPHYGQKLEEIAYIPVMPLIARLEWSDHLGSGKHRDHVEKLAADFLSGKKLPKVGSGSDMAGFLLFAELAKRAQGNDKSAPAKLALAAANLAFNSEGNPRDIAPFHNEMSDAVFMSGPIYAAAGKLTGDGRYHDASVRHIESMRELIDRKDGLCRHSPLCEAAWGRGNGFVALGLSLVLDDLPADHPGRARLEAMALRHLRALVKHQDPTGAWHQVVDEPGSYRELSATCMITFAMLRGVRRGRLSKAEFGPVIQRAWPAILARVGPNGHLVDICTGTGKQKTLRDYFNRPAVFGPDARGGGMALLVAVEKARAESK